tara:strand:- start:6698 stop:7327 length:630 start_codon:yes stop_codon:yes gene_type:complete
MYINPENKSPIFIIHNCLNLEKRNKIIEVYKDRTVLGTHQSKSEQNKNKRNSNVHFIEDNPQIAMMLMSFIKVGNHLTQYNYDLTSNEMPQFTSYGKTQHYNYHVDSDSHIGRKFIFDLPKENNLAYTDDVNLINTIRKMSCSLILNDDYEGGEFCTKILIEGKIVEHTIPAKAGDILIFPSNITHGVKPVTKGIRYSLVMWAAGPTFK